MTLKFIMAKYYYSGSELADETMQATLRLPACFDRMIVVLARWFQILLGFRKYMRTATLLIMIIFLIGCNSQSDRQSQSVQDDSGSNGAKIVTEDRVESLLKLTERPKSAEQLTSMFIETYRSDPKTAFKNFFDWSDLSQQSRRKILNGLLSLSDSSDRNGTYTLENAALSIVDIERHSAELGLSVKEFQESMPVAITHVFQFEIEKPNGIVIHTTLGIGQRDEVFYFYPDYYPDRQ